MRLCCHLEPTTQRIQRWTKIFVLKKEKRNLSTLPKKPKRKSSGNRQREQKRVTERASSNEGSGLTSLLAQLELISATPDDAVMYERAHACEYEAYRNHTDARYGDKRDPEVDAATMIGQLDEIPGPLIARVAVSTLLNVAPACCRRGLQILLGHRRPPRVPREVEEYNKRRRGVPPEIREDVAEAVRHLAGPAIRLYKFDVDKHRTTCSCGSFFVAKKAGADGVIRLRTILDARLANAKMDNSTQLRQARAAGSAVGCAAATPRSTNRAESRQEDVDNVDYYFPLISLEELYRLIASMHAVSNKRSQQYYVINADFRHYYHQLPLHKSLRPFFTMMLEGRGELAEWYVPRALPMGWILAPNIAQCCTWAMLFGGHGKLERGVHGIDASEVARMKTLPAWIALEGGGGIVVLMDNILVITPSADIAEAWAKRMRSFAKPSSSGGFNVVYKGDVNVQTIRKPGAAAASACSAASSGRRAGSETAEHFEFLGVKWWYDQRQLAVDESEPWPAGLDVKTRTWTGKHRELASVVGRLLWFHRVARHGMFATAMQGFRQLMSRVTPPEGRWDAYVQELPTACVDAMIDGWKERQQKPTFFNEPPLELGEREFAYAAVDASEDAYGAVYWDLSLANRPSEWTSPRAPTFSYIALSELASIIIAVHELKARNPHANTLVIATDNQTAKTWIENRGAKSAVANMLLELLFNEVLGNKTDLWLTYVRSKANAADPASRRSSMFAPEEEYRIALTVESLRVRALPAGRPAGGHRRERDGDDERNTLTFA